MAGLNKAMLIGHLGRDPEVRNLNNGGKVVNLSIATSESWRDKATGEKKERTEWHRVVIFNEGLGKIAEQYLKKGSQCYVEGKIQTRKWQDQGGNDKYSTEIVLTQFDGRLTLLGKGEGGGGGDRNYEQHTEGATRREAAQPSYAEELDDEIPF